MGPESNHICPPWRKLEEILGQTHGEEEIQKRRSNVIIDGEIRGM